MNILDLFSGIGGFSLGFESANFKSYDFTKLSSEQNGKNDGFFKTLAFCQCDKDFVLNCLCIRSKNE